MLQVAPGARSAPAPGPRRNLPLVVFNASVDAWGNNNNNNGMMGITFSTFSKVNGEHGFSISVFLFADKDVGYAMDQSADSLENYNEPSREVSGIRTVMMLIHQQALIIVSSLVYFCHLPEHLRV